MKILMINVVCGIRSTGRICTDLASALEAKGNEVKIAYGRESVPTQFEKYALKVGTDLDVNLHALKARVFDCSGFGSKRYTRKFIKWVKEYDPDIIHLHNIHGYYIDIEVLFDYLKSCNKKIIWTLHDCWSFTGHCVYFDFVDCDKWKTGCGHCPQKSEYPARVGFDMSRKNYRRKKELFTGVNNMTLVTPSKWLANLVSKSYMKEYKTKVIYNGIDTNIFRPTKTSIKEKYNCQDKKIILGVAAVWDKRKGLNIFIELSKYLERDYQIILVGLSQTQIRNLPCNIIGIERTNDIHELVELYSAAYVFVNPTLEDNYPTTNIEAISCGTPVITYKTGGSTESAKMYGIVVAQNTINELVKAIAVVDQVNPKVVNIDYKDTVRKYIELYEER